MCELGLQVRPAIKTIEAVEVDEEKLWLYGVACCTNLEVYICCLAFLPLGWGREAVVGVLVAYPSSRGMLLLQGLAEWIFKIGPLIK